MYKVCRAAWPTNQPCHIPFVGSLAYNEVSPNVSKLLVISYASRAAEIILVMYANRLSNRKVLFYFFIISLPHTSVLKVIYRKWFGSSVEKRKKINARGEIIPQGSLREKCFHASRFSDSPTLRIYAAFSGPLSC